MLQTYSLIGDSLPCIKFLITGRISPLCSNIMQLVHFYWGYALCFVHILLADIDIFFMFLRDSSAKSATYSVYSIKWDMLICNVGQWTHWKGGKKKAKIVNPAVYLHIVQGSNILAVAILMYKDTHCKLTLPDKLSWFKGTNTHSLTCITKPPVWCHFCSSHHSAGLGYCWTSTIALSSFITNNSTAKVNATCNFF